MISKRHARIRSVRRPDEFVSTAARASLVALVAATLVSCGGTTAPAAITAQSAATTSPTADAATSPDPNAGPSQPAPARPRQVAWERRPCPLDDIVRTLTHRAVPLHVDCAAAREPWTIQGGVVLDADELHRYLGCPDGALAIDDAREQVVVFREGPTWQSVVETPKDVVLYHPPLTPSGCPGVQGIALSEAQRRARARVDLTAIPRSSKPVALHSCYTLAPECSLIP